MRFERCPERPRASRSPACCGEQREWAGLVASSGVGVERGREGQLERIHVEFSCGGRRRKKMTDSC